MNRPSKATALLQLPAHERYEYFLDYLLDEEQVWILKDDEGCLIVGTGGDTCLPVWPGAEAATACAVKEWDGFEALAISLADWKNKWLPGLAGDGHQIVVCPDVHGEGVIVSADDLAADLADAAE